MSQAEESAENVMAYLVEAMESMTIGGLDDLPDPDRARARSAWKDAPATLVQLWDWHGGRSTCPLFSLARPLVQPFPSDESILEFRPLELLTPSALADWIAEARAFDASTADDPYTILDYLKARYPSHIPIAWTEGHVMCVGEEGVSVWYSNTEYFAVEELDEREVYDSFDRWMRDTAKALRTGVLRIERNENSNPLVFYCDKYVLDWEGDTSWERK